MAKHLLQELLIVISAAQFIAHAFTSPIYSRINSANRVGTVAPLPPPRASAILKEQTDTTNDGDKDEKLRIVVVGGGWAGYSFCESISTNNIDGKNVEIILLDASKQAKGGLAGGYRSKNDRPVEAGIHGFWREYRNTFDIMSDIEGVNVDEVLGDFTPSVLWSKNGKVAVAPVLLEEEGGQENIPTLNNLSEQSIRRFIASNLPPPLDLPVLAQLDNSKAKSGDTKLNPADLLSGIGLLGAWADFEQESRASWENYDTQPASLLFEKAGISDAVYEELVSPLLHVLPMCPAYDCSAAAALSCFHVFALQSRGAFDVRWCRGSISEKIFEPWQKQLEQRGVDIRGGSRVSSIEKNENDKYTIELQGDENNAIDCDAVILAVGATAAGRLASSSPAISSLESTKDFDKLRGVTCVAVRLFLKPNPTVSSNLDGGSHDKTQLPPDIAQAMSDSPISVCGAGIGGIEELKETGFCIYDLQRMHDEFSVDYYNKNVEESDQVAVLEVDFYRADSFVNMDDGQIADLALRTVSAAFGTAKIDSDGIIDATVLRARNAVSHFAPNSALYSPDVKLGDGMYICGDWVDRTGHASWSTEKAVVTARQAAAVFTRDFGLKNSQCKVIPAAKDTPQLSALRQSTRLLRNLLPPKTLPPSPWVFAKQLLSGDKEP
mmetsp:Transcript_9078/g.20516  ORF Transcript_9078/g.20516 Transcript_9078/m.20516 type:complete len:664 (-) Transcript_9078:56-2047(-)